MVSVRGGFELPALTENPMAISLKRPSPRHRTIFFQGWVAGAAEVAAELGDLVDIVV